MPRHSAISSSVHALQTSPFAWYHYGVGGNGNGRNGGEAIEKDAWKGSDCWAWGRFLSVDPRAEKYAGWSPYNFVMGNPILNIDPRGDTVKIAHKGNQYTYDNGQVFLGKDLYTGKQKGFLKRSVKALNTINSTSEGGAMLNELSGSTNIFTIVDAKFNKSGRESETFPTNRSKAYANQFLTDPNAAAETAAKSYTATSLSGGSGATIYWNSSGTTIATTKGPRSNGTTDLAHELFHGLDGNRGLMDSRPHLDIKTDRNEWQAVYRENILRQQLGLPLRTHYIKEMDSNNVFTRGVGPSFLNKTGAPILPSWYKK